MRQVQLCKDQWNAHKGEAHQRMPTLQGRRLSGTRYRHDITWQVLNIHEKEINISITKRLCGHPLAKQSNLTSQSLTAWHCGPRGRQCEAHSTNQEVFWPSRFNLNWIALSPHFQLKEIPEIEEQVKQHHKETNPKCRVFNKNGLVSSKSQRYRENKGRETVVV